ncbi:MAG TPA: hypothetical protein VLF15_13590, partial [Pseudoxanthomonas sp.]|nr:hypothetical protein [Pseudoxanthomonas sp.]
MTLEITRCDQIGRRSTGTGTPGYFSCIGSDLTGCISWQFFGLAMKAVQGRIPTAHDAAAYRMVRCFPPSSRDGSPFAKRANDIQKTRLRSLRETPHAARFCSGPDICSQCSA